nr:PKD domain-containing protein [Succinimonas amylolytica]
MNHKPKASFTISKNFLKVTATNTSTDQDGPADIVSYAWTSSDGGSATTKDYAHTFASPGTYTISLVVTDSKGATSATATKTVTVEAANNVPVASFTVASNYLDIAATNTSIDQDGPADIVSYAWTSSDGGSATTKDYVHTFAAPGTYTISLVVTDSKGASSAAATKIITVEANNNVPVASFTVASNYLDIVATNTSIDQDGPADIVSYAWTSSDGGSAATKDYVHTFTTPGTYTVSLVVTDSKGARSEVATKTVTVEASNNVPVASFTVTSNYLNVTATNTSTDQDGPEDIVSYAWTSSDGGSAATKDYVHTFAAPGTYTISLVVTDSKGASSVVATNIVTVEAANNVPVASFTVASNYLDITATSTSTDQDGPADIVSYAWTSSDGGSATTKDYVHTFVAPGTYTISLVVTDSKGASSVAAIKTVTVEASNNVPVASFTIASNYLDITATNTSSDQDGPSDIVSYAWTSSDGDSATTKNYAHTFAAPGTYTISLVVTDSKGAVSVAATKTVTVEKANNVPVASFTVASNYLDITATSTSSDQDGPSDIVSYSWTSSDGGSATTRNYAHTFAAPGTYTISLVVTDSKGASSAVASQNVTVESEPIIPTALFSCGSQTLDLIEIDDNNSYYAESIICSIDGELQSSLNYSWNVVGDGVTCESPNSDISTYICTFSKNTEVSIGLTVSDSLGNSNNSNISYTSSDVFKADFYDRNQSIDEQLSPKDGFVSNPSLNAEFVSNSVVKTGGNYTFTWNFGDGSNKSINTNTNISNTLHSYISPTVYEPVLTIKDNTNGIETKVSNKYYYFNSKYCSGSVFGPYHKMSYMYFNNDNNQKEYVFISNAKERCADTNADQCPSSLSFYYDNILSTDVSEIVYGGHSYTVGKGVYGTLKSYTSSDLFGYNGNHQLKVTAVNNLSDSEDCSFDIRIGKSADSSTYSSINVGDLVQFGTLSSLEGSVYRVKDRPIIWEVIRKSSGKIMLLQVFEEELYNKSTMTFSSASSATIWPNSNVRSILNSNFLNKQYISLPKYNSNTQTRLSFSDFEKSKIVPISNYSDLWNYAAHGGNVNADCIQNPSCLWEGVRVDAYTVPNNYYYKHNTTSTSSTDYLFLLNVYDVKNNYAKNHWPSTKMFQLRDLFAIGGSGGRCTANENGFNCSLGDADNATKITYGAAVGGISYEFARKSGFKITLPLTDNYFRLATWIEL